MTRLGSRMIIWYDGPMMGSCFTAHAVYVPWESGWLEIGKCGEQLGLLEIISTFICLEFLLSVNECPCGNCVTVHKRNFWISNYITHYDGLGISRRLGSAESRHLFRSRRCLSSVWGLESYLIWEENTGFGRSCTENNELSSIWYSPDTLGLEALNKSNSS